MIFHLWYDLGQSQEPASSGISHFKFFADFVLSYLHLCFLFFLLMLEDLMVFLQFSCLVGFDLYKFIFLVWYHLFCELVHLLLSKIIFICFLVSPFKLLCCHYVSVLICIFYIFFCFYYFYIIYNLRFLCWWNLCKFW